MARYRILSVDGGGVKGIYASVLLERLQAQTRFLDKADLLAGTSTGGIIALALASGLTPCDITAFYRDTMAAVFEDSILDDIKDISAFGVSVRGAQYSTVRLRQGLRRMFGSKRLHDLDRRVIIPTFDLDGRSAGVRMWKPKFYHNFPGRGSDGKEYAYDVALRTSAAPMYFPVYQGHVDGGIVANNPSMAALAQALHPGTGGQALRDIRLFSLGTGLSPSFIPGSALDWGALQWAPRLTAMTIEGMMGVADYQCAQLLGGSYHRLAPLLSRKVHLDDADKKEYLMRQAAQAGIRPSVAWIRRSW